jgi:hypothetical protein
MALIPQVIDTESSSATKFQIVFDRIPNVVFNAVNCQFPSMEIGTANQSTPIMRMPFAGTNLEHGPFSMQFILNESHSNYGEILHWMNGLKYPTDFSIFTDGNKGETEYSDFVVSIRNNANIPTVSYRFTHGFPINLSPLSFDSQLTDDEPILISVTFDFQELIQVPLGS